jgi:phage terminase large subunit GpA-like protein
MVMSRLMVGQPGPGYMHLPHWLDDEFIEQLTAERAVFKYVKGRGSVREWEKLRDRNEAFDLEVYALAALYIRGPLYVKSLGQLAKRISTRLTTDSGQADLPPVIVQASQAIKKQGKSWVKDF